MQLCKKAKNISRWTLLLVQRYYIQCLYAMCSSHASDVSITGNNGDKQTIYTLNENMIFTKIMKKPGRRRYIKHEANTIVIHCTGITISNNMDNVSTQPKTTNTIVVKKAMINISPHMCAAIKLSCLSQNECLISCNKFVLPYIKHLKKKRAFNLMMRKSDVQPIYFFD